MDKVLYRQNSTDIQYIGNICSSTECSETQVAASSAINCRKFSVLFLTTCSPLTASSSVQYSDHSAIVPINQSMM